MTQDLFTDLSIACGTAKAPQQSTYPGFDRWWAAWPKNGGMYTRKTGRAHCLKRWVAHHHESQAETIVRHTEWMKTTADWLKDQGAFIPMPATYLNQQRWDGAEIPEKPVSATDETEQYLREQAAHEARCRAEHRPAAP